MTYLMIKNRGSFDRLYLELIGFSTKRARTDDPRIIGFKGSGTKLALLAAIRFGLDLHVASSDERGQYLLHYEVEDIACGGNRTGQVVFSYDVGKRDRDGRPVYERQRSQLTTDAFMDWDRPIGDDTSGIFKVLREYVCNAWDEGEGFTLTRVAAPAMVPPGETAVYLLDTPEIDNVLVNAARYFKFLEKGPLGRAVFAVPGLGAIYPKSEPDRRRLFVRGVLVDCNSFFLSSSMFDYSLDERTLISEERVIRNMSDYEKELGRLFSRLDDVRLATVIMEATKGHRSSLETAALATVDKLEPAARAAWVKAAVAVYGPKVCVGADSKTTDENARQIYGYQAVSNVYNALGKFLLKLGFPKAEDIVPKGGDEAECSRVCWAQLDDASRSRFLEAWRMFARHFPERAVYPVVFYAPISTRMKPLAGHSGLGEKQHTEVWIAVSQATSLGETDQILRVLVHESRHCATRANDYDRPFILQTERDMSKLIMSADHGVSSETPVPPPCLADLSEDDG